MNYPLIRQSAIINLVSFMSILDNPAVKLSARFHGFVNKRYPKPPLDSSIVIGVTLDGFHTIRLALGQSQISSHYIHTQSFYCSSGICPGLPGWAGTRKVKPVRVKPIWIYWSKRQWVAVASLCMSAPHRRQPRQHPTTQFFTGWMPFLPPNQQHHISCINEIKLQYLICKPMTSLCCNESDLQRNTHVNVLFRVTTWKWMTRSQTCNRLNSSPVL